VSEYSNINNTNLQVAGATVCGKVSLPNHIPVIVILGGVKSAR
jgi:hypothetical protein